MYRVRIEAQAALLADSIDALVLGVILGELHEGVPYHDMVVLIRAHETAEYDLAGQAALVGKRRRLGTQDERVVLPYLKTVGRRDTELSTTMFITA